MTPFEYILDILHDAWNRNFALFDIHKYVQQFVFKIYKKFLKLCEANFYSCLNIKRILRLIDISFRRNLQDNFYMHFICMIGANLKLKDN